MDESCETGFDLSADPRAVWTAWIEEGRVAGSDRPPPADSAFAWLHLDVSLPPSQRWIHRNGGLPDEVAALFLSREETPAAAIAGGFVAAVLPDFEREFASVDTGKVGALRFVLGPERMLSGRRHPLHTPDVMRHRLTWAKQLDAPAALDLLLASLLDTFAARAQTVSTDLLTIEDQLLADEEIPDLGKLIGIRRLTARIHRMLAGSRAVLIQLDGDPALPAAYRPIIGRSLARVAALESDVAAAQGHLRLLREELDLQAGQRTNENVYLLSIVTVLLMPATLVTGFFGMNTGGLPFSQGIEGTFLATLIALAVSCVTWLVLRRMGLVRR